MIAWGQIDNLEEVDPEWQALLPKYPSEAIRPVILFYLHHFYSSLHFLNFIGPSYPAFHSGALESPDDVC